MVRWPLRVSMCKPKKEVDMLQVVQRQLCQSSIILFSLGALHLKSACVLHFMAVAEGVAAKEGPCLLAWIQWIR